MLKLWIIEFDRVDTWRAAAAGGFPLSFHSSFLLGSSLGVCGICSSNKTRPEMAFTGFISWMSSFWLVPCLTYICKFNFKSPNDLQSCCSALIAEGAACKGALPHLTDISGLDSAFALEFSLEVCQLVESRCQMYPSTGMCVWGGGETTFPCRTMPGTCTPLSVTAV